ncbi:Protease Do-like 2, chloroplastic [Glycine soja]
MAVALTSCISSSSVLFSTVKFRYSLRHRPIVASFYNNNNYPLRLSSSSSSSSKSNRQKEGVGQKKQSKDERPARGNVLEPQQTSSSKPFGIQRKNKDLIFDSKDQQVLNLIPIADGLPPESQPGKGETSTGVEPSALQDSAFLNAVVKVKFNSYIRDHILCSAFMIGDRKLLTNAHCVEHDTQVKVKKRGDDSKYVAKVLARGVDCDIALLSVESEEFWRDVEPLRLGRLPHLQDSVTVVGYPLGGDTISVTKGVVSRIEVTSYAHGSSDLLGIQIDAAINPGNSGGPAFNDQGECIGVAFQVLRSDEAENIGYVIPTTVVSHFLTDYERNGRYTGFPCLGVLIQKLENPALRAWLKVQSNEGVLVRRVEPTSDANNVLKEGDVIVSFDDVRVGSEGTVPFRSNERIAFHFLISQKFAGDTAELGIIRAGSLIKTKVVLNSRVHLVPYHIDEGQPSYLIIAGLVFTPLSEPLIEEECEDSIGLKLLARARYSLAKFKGEQIVILSQVVKFNGTRIKNIHHLAHLIDSCKDRYLRFEFEDSYVAVLEKESVTAASPSVLSDYGIPSERSSDLLKPYVDALEVEGDQPADEEFGDSPVSNYEFGPDGLLWA